jgi:hypothetical protein
MPQKFIDRAIPQGIASAILAKGNAFGQDIATLFSAVSGVLPPDDEIVMPIDDQPGGGNPTIVVYFPVYTEGYLVSGQVSGSMARNYSTTTSPSTFIANATIIHGPVEEVYIGFPTEIGFEITRIRLGATDIRYFAANQIPVVAPTPGRKYLFKFIRGISTVTKHILQPA